MVLHFLHADTAARVRYYNFLALALSGAFSSFRFVLPFLMAPFAPTVHEDVFSGKCTRAISRGDGCSLLILVASRERHGFEQRAE